MNTKKENANNGKGNKNADKKTANKGVSAGNSKGTNTAGTENAIAPVAKTETAKVDEPAAGAPAAGAPAAPAAAPVKKVTIKVVPKKVRQGGGRSSAITYNIGTCPYNMLVTKTDKDTKVKDTKHLRHILNGAWVPTFNGMEGAEVDTTQPVFDSVEAAFAANPLNVGFGISTREDGTDFPTIFSFTSNINNITIKGDEPAEGQPDLRTATIAGTLTHHAPANACALALIAGKNDGVSWKWFGHIEASKENAATVAANLQKYMESPYADKNIVSHLTLLPAPWILSSGAAVSVGAPAAETKQLVEA